MSVHDMYPNKTLNVLAKLTQSVCLINAMPQSLLAEPLEDGNTREIANQRKQQPDIQGLIQNLSIRCN